MDQKTNSTIIPSCEKCGCSELRLLYFAILMNDALELGLKCPMCENAFSLSMDRNERASYLAEFRDENISFDALPCISAYKM